MNSLQNLKHFNIIPAQNVTTSATIASNTVDTKGYDDLQIVFTRVTSAAADAMTSFAIQSADEDAASAFAAVTGYVSGTDYTLASIVGGANTAAAKPSVFNIDLRGKKRYFRIQLQTATAGYIAATASLGRAEQSPITASTQGCAVVVNPS